MRLASAWICGSILALALGSTSVWASPSDDEEADDPLDDDTVVVDETDDIDDTRDDDDPLDDDTDDAVVLVDDTDTDTDTDDEAESTTKQKKPARGSRRGEDFDRHGIGVRAGMTVIPTWIFSTFVEAHTNALCRGDSLTNFAVTQGLTRTDGCNFYVGGEYVYRRSRVFDIVPSIGYLQIHAPDGLWLDEFDTVAPASGGSAVGGADYTEVDLGIMFMEVDFIARAPLVVRENIEFGLGGGGGVGLGIVFGGVYQTALGSDPDGYVPGVGETPGETCQFISDLSDLQRCTPRYDPLEDPDGTPPPPEQLDPSMGGSARPYARCSREECTEQDLAAFGYRRKSERVPPVIPIINLIASARLIVKDMVGITLSGGFNTGFYFGGSLTYFVGKYGKSKSKDKSKKQAVRASLLRGV